MESLRWFLPGLFRPEVTLRLGFVKRKFTVFLWIRHVTNILRMCRDRVCNARLRSYGFWGLPVFPCSGRRLYRDSPSAVRPQFCSVRLTVDVQRRLKKKTNQTRGRGDAANGKAIDDRSVARLRDNRQTCRVRQTADRAECGLPMGTRRAHVPDRMRDELYTRRVSAGAGKRSPGTVTAVSAAKRLPDCRSAVRYAFGRTIPANPPVARTVGRGHLRGYDLYP